jgi:hypothetical protein
VPKNKSARGKRGWTLGLLAFNLVEHAHAAVDVVHKNHLARPLRARNSPLVRLPVHLGQRLAHHSELCLTVPFENLGVALSQHLRHHMVGDTTRA